MNSTREERTALLDTLIALREQQKKIKSVKLDKLVHKTELYLKKLYKEAVIRHSLKYAQTEVAPS